MPGNVLSRLMLVLGADTAQIQRDMGKAKQIVRSSSDDMQAAGTRAMQKITTEVKGVGGAIRGVQPAVSGAMAALNALGAQAPGQIGAVSNALASLAAGGFTPVGIALAAVTTGIALFAAKSKEVEEMERALQKVRDRTAALTDELTKLNAQSALLGAGRSAESLDVAIAVAEQRVADARARRDGATGSERRRLGIEGDVLETELSALRTQQAILERIAAQRAKAADAARLEADRQKAIAAAAAAAAAEQEKVRAASIRAAEALTTADERRRAEIASAQLALDALLDPSIDAEIEAQRARAYAALRAVSRAPEGSFERTNAQRQLEHERELLRLLEARREEEERQAAAAAAQAETDAAANAEASRAAADLERERQAAARAEEARLRVVQEVTGAIADAESDLRFDLEQQDRDETEQRVAEVQRRYQALLDRAREYGVGVVEIEKLIAEEVRRIRAAAEKPPEPGAPGPTGAAPGFGDSFAARAREIADRNTAEQLGRDFADRTILGGANDLADALWSIADGSERAGQAFRRMAQSILEDLAKIALRQAAVQLLATILGVPAGGINTTSLATPGGGVPATTGAHGGTWRVGGFGGLDSQLVAMKLSPGELVRVTDGANSRGGAGGDVHVDLVMRPPAVIADDVMARSSREAKAAVVSKAVRRPGQRGWRPRD